METKIVSIVQNSPSDLSVNVDFLDGESIALSRTYSLAADQDVETLYPQFKEDLNSLEAAKAKIAALELSHVNKPLDLSGVQSTSELQAAQEQAQRELVAQAASQEPASVAPDVQA